MTPLASRHDKEQAPCIATPAPQPIELGVVAWVKCL
jgi:hypothetical protein